MVLTYLSLANQKLEQWSKAEATINTSIQILETQITYQKSDEKIQIHAQAINTRGLLELALGQPNRGRETWQLATQLYQQINDKTGVTGTKINQAQALEALGFYRRTCKTLLQTLQLNNDCNWSHQGEWQTVEQTFQAQSDSQIKLLGLRSLGNILRLMGELEYAQKVLDSSLKIPQSPQDKAATWLSLGKTQQAWFIQEKKLYHRTNLPTEKRTAFEQANSYVRQALANYLTAIKTSKLKTFTIQAQLQHLKLLIEFQQWLKEIFSEKQSSQIQALELQINTQVTDLLHSKIAQLSPSRTAIYAQLNFAQSLLQLSSQQSQFFPMAIDYASLAVRGAKQLSDPQTKSLAFGTLGHLYEQKHQ